MEQIMPVVWKKNEFAYEIIQNQQHSRVFSNYEDLDAGSQLKILLQLVRRKKQSIDTLPNEMQLVCTDNKEFENEINQDKRHYLEKLDSQNSDAYK